MPNSRNKPSSALLALPISTLAASLLLALPAFAQETAADGQAAKTLDAVRVTGSRVLGRTAEETAAPVDIIGQEELANTGAMEVGQALQLLEPSFNFSRTTVSDGTDILRPATLRALGPDQVLVLVNGKRRHQQALVNVQQTIARGSAGTDINAIPVSAIERIEVLRDGAAAQYGSDAIAGVINIILKTQTDHTDVSLMAGETYEGDGRVLHGSVNTGFALGDGGFINLTGEYRDRGETNRAGKATTNALGWYDQAEFDAGRRDVKLHLGDADAKDAYLWMNGELPIGPGALYWFGGLSKREGESFGFYRGPHDNRTIPDLYPDGFLPKIVTTVEDASLAVGYRADLGENWEWDVSINHGRNKFSFEEHNTANVSWWYEPAPGGGIYGETPTQADTGTLRFEQTTFNLDLSGDVDGFGDNPLYLAAGFEWREDRYIMEAGDPVSYTYGRTNDPSIPIFGQTGDPAPSGTQGFPGFTPATEVDDGRHSMAVYFDAETNLTEKLLVGAAVRFEDYSDFGNTTKGKLSLRYDASEVFAFRGTIASGFRAPGVQQEFFSQVSTNLNNGVLTEVLTARNDSDVARALGIPALKEETSLSKSFGIVFKPIENFSITADIFRIDIEDRLVYSEGITPETIGTDGLPCTPTNSNCPIAAALAPFRAGVVQFFTNAIDTSTTGLDIVANAQHKFASGSNLNLTALLHFNKTEVTDVHSESPIIPESSIFGIVQETLIEQGQPREHHVLQGIWSNDKWEVTVRENYFGEVAGLGFGPYEGDGKWLADLAVAYKFSDKIKLTVGGNNIFDVYPDKWDPDVGFPFPQAGFTYGWETMPFGMNGGSYYARLDFRF
ncbi:TonB-dependent receptor [Luteimonas sp. SX5]|uniref:TonB-dependent receptor n=1 Tax=Luteimonas galliterrae TaxID=2940486 RepID=A0ABT0MGI8_9GAMM|nr:TonB-dependent receptor [Luteimonas galliterrae]MCL1633984.1 TonB-dependent receptor [Luteimonas galliterrae]